MAGTNVPPIEWTPTGLVVPTAAEILAGVLADLNAAFNGNLNLALNTPQGQLASSLAAIIQQCYGAMAYLTGNVNPAAAQDFMQDAIGYIYYLTRNSGTPTVVACTCAGVVGTVIPAGSEATDTSGNLYASTAAGTIGAGGTVTISFQNQNDGPIPCAPSTLTQIYQAVTGWESITNPSSGILGTNTESAAAFAARMQASVAVNAQGSLPSLYGALAALPGVTAVYCVENDTSSPVSTGPTDYSVAANSVYAAVVGGTASQIAQTIFTKKSPGCNTNGNQSIVVYDTTYPEGSQPAYTIKFEIPNDLAMTFTVALGSSSGLPANIDTLIQNAMLAQFQDGSSLVPAVGIASQILAATYFSPVLATFTGLPLLSILMGTAFSGTCSLSGTTLTVSSVTSGFLTAGCYVVDTTHGTAIPSNTYVVEQLTGTPGGAGTYELSASCTTESGDTVTSTTGNLQTFQAGIDQIPVLSAANIVITT
jgi:uncharacterized phage protein gp47/JayE